MFFFIFLFYLCLSSSLVPMVLFYIRQKNSYKYELIFCSRHYNFSFYGIFDSWYEFIYLYEFILPFRHLPWDQKYEFICDMNSTYEFILLFYVPMSRQTFEFIFIYEFILLLSKITIWTKVLMSMKTYEFILIYEFICPLSKITIGTREDAKQFVKNKYETKHKFPNNNI